MFHKLQVSLYKHEYYRSSKLSPGPVIASLHEFLIVNYTALDPPLLRSHLLRKETSVSTLTNVFNCWGDIGPAVLKRQLTIKLNAKVTVVHDPPSH